MHRRLVTRQLSVACRNLFAAKGRRSFLSPLVVGLGIWAAFPTAIAYQDMTSLMTGLEAPGSRWNSFVEKAVAGSTHAAEMPFANVDANSMSGSGVSLPGIGTVAFRGKSAAASDRPDEDRVHRSDKQGRVVNVTPVAPPKSFNAGSVFDRTSSLLRPTMDGELRMTFLQSEIVGQEIAIAAAFHASEDPEEAKGVPTMLADLVNNDRPDILATAYAPAAPDYARASPFESLLREEDPNNGRFVPPMSKGDHAWMSKPLPAEVFSSEEQKCLATGIYFEARGENLRGQAAVAQVILNRVRNPAYPNTICGVVYQNDGWRNRCQFSFACDGIPDRVNSPQNYKVAEQIAMATTAGKIFIDEVGSATHYHATYVNPRWAHTMQKMKKIGLHIFYRTYGGGWS